MLVKDVNPPEAQIVRLKLTTRQVRELQRVATSMGINVSELLRRLLDSWIERRGGKANA